MIGIILETQSPSQDWRLALGEAELQTADNVVRAMRGEFKEAPLVGGEVRRMMGGRPSIAWCVDVEKMLQSVGIDSASVSMDDKQITVNV